MDEILVQILPIGQRGINCPGEKYLARALAGRCRSGVSTPKGGISIKGAQAQAKE